MKIQLATISEIDSVVSLIKMRIDWMDKQGINQWNKSDYLETFTLDYFNQVITNRNLYVVKNDVNVTVGAFALFCEDARWDDGLSALYIHNFVSHIDYPKVGDGIINFCEEMVKERGLYLLRIDCQQENIKLNNYYSDRGFEYISSFEEEKYRGNRREKRIIPE